MKLESELDGFGSMSEYASDSPEPFDCLNVYNRVNLLLDYLIFCFRTNACLLDLEWMIKVCSVGELCCESGHAIGFYAY